MKIVYDKTTIGNSPYVRKIISLHGSRFFWVIERKEANQLPEILRGVSSKKIVFEVAIELSQKYKEVWGEE